MPGPDLAWMELYAWVGEDEHGSGIVGLKQLRMPCGITPLVVIREHKGKIMRPNVQESLQIQANTYGKTITFARFLFGDALITLEPKK